MLIDEVAKMLRDKQKSKFEEILTGEGYIASRGRQRNSSRKGKGPPLTSRGLPLEEEKPTLSPVSKLANNSSQGRNKLGCRQEICILNCSLRRIW